MINTRKIYVGDVVITLYRDVNHVMCVENYAHEIFKILYQTDDMDIIFPKMKRIIIYEQQLSCVYYYKEYTRFEVSLNSGLYKNDNGYDDYGINFYINHVWHMLFIISKETIAQDIKKFLTSINGLLEETKKYIM